MPEPIKIGWLGAALDGPGGGYDKIHRLAFDEAVESGLLDRPFEFVLHPENGLPQGRRRTPPTAFGTLVDEGCIGVAGAYSSDNAITVGAAGQRARGAAHQLGRHGAPAGRVLLPARQRRLSAATRRWSSRG